MQKTIYPPIITYMGENSSKFIEQLENAYNHQFWQHEGNNRQLYRSGESIIAIEKGKAPDNHLSISPSDITLPVSERYFSILVKRLTKNKKLFHTDYITVYQDNKQKVQLALEKNFTLTVIPKKQATPVTISNTETPLAPDHTVFHAEDISEVKKRLETFFGGDILRRVGGNNRTAYQLDIRSLGYPYTMSWIFRKNQPLINHHALHVKGNWLSYIKVVNNAGTALGIQPAFDQNTMQIFIDACPTLQQLGKDILEQCRVAHIELSSFWGPDRGIPNLWHPGQWNKNLLNARLAPLMSYAQFFSQNSTEAGAFEINGRFLGFGGITYYFPYLAARQGIGNKNQETALLMIAGIN